MKKQLAWILGGGAVVACGILGTMSGCSSSTTTPDASTPDATNGMDSTKPDTSTGNDAGMMEASTCDVTPKGPFEGGAGAYCPYLADGGDTNCGVGNHCCIPAEGTGASTCEPGGTACTFADASAKNANFFCNATADCTNGQICCLNSPATLGQDQGCTSYYYVSKDNGSTCTTGSCGGQPQLCGQNSDCTTSGDICWPLSTLGMWLGVCQPQ